MDVKYYLYFEHFFKKCIDDELQPKKTENATIFNYIYILFGRLWKVKLRRLAVDLKNVLDVSAQKLVLQEFLQPENLSARS